MLSKLKLILPLLIVFAVSLISEAKKITVNGEIFDRLTVKTLPGVKITVTDSEGNIIKESEANHKITFYKIGDVFYGKFSFDIESTGDHYNMQLKKDGYETLDVPLDLSKISGREFEMKLPPVYMTPLSNEKTTELDEVVVKATKIKFYHKGDTIVYNADAFMLPEGSTLDALIAQLPGVEIKEGGKIYVNGKYVESLLLNGKDFFKGNQDVLRQNIGAYTVKNIAVYDKYGSMSNLLGQQLQDDKEYVMDVRLKKDYMGGFMGTAEAAYGTHGRYAGRLFAMHFNNNARFAVYGNLNNLNNTNRPNEYGVNYNSAPNGISKISNGGFDYMVNDPLKVWNVSGNIDFNYTDNTTGTNTFSESFLQQGNTYMSSFANNRDKSFNFKTEHYFDYTKKLYYFKLRPTFNYRRTKTESASAAVTFNTDIQDRYDVDAAVIEAIYHGTPLDVKEAIVNRNRYYKNNRLNNYKAYLWSEQAVKFPGSPDALNLWIEGEYNRDHSNGSTNQLIDYGFNGINSPTSSSAFSRDNVRFPAYSGFIKAALRYYINFRNATLNFGYEFRHEQERKTSLEMLFDERFENEEAILPADMQLMPDLPNTNSSKRYANIHMLKANLNYNTKSDKVNFIFNLSPEFHIRNRHLYYNAYEQGESGMIPVMIPVSRTAYSFNNSSLGFYLKFPDFSNYLSLNYRFNTQYASLSDLIDLPNTTDPLNLSHGNPNLKDQYSQNVSLTVNTTPAKNTSITLMSEFFYDIHSIVRGYTYNSNTGVRDYEAQNVSGSCGYFAILQGYKAFGPENHQISIRANVQHFFNRRVNLIGEDGPLEQQIIYNNRLGFYFSAKYTLLKSYTLSAGITDVNYFSRSGSELIGNTVTRKIIPNVSIDLKLPYNFSFNTNMEYRINKGSANKAMNFNECILGASLQYQLNSNWGFKIQGYDLLNQQRNTTIDYSASGRTQIINMSLPRYVLFSVTYKFNTKPKN